MSHLKQVQQTTKTSGKTETKKIKIIKNNNNRGHLACQMGWTNLFK